MTEYIPSTGKEPEDIRRAAIDLCRQGTVSVRFTVLGFQRLCDENGHVVRVDLPGAICSYVRAHPGCRYAEVLRTPQFADASIVAVIETRAMLDQLIKALSRHEFRLPQWAGPEVILPRLPLETAIGSLDEALGVGP